MAQHYTPGVLHDPAAATYVLRGFSTLAQILAQTLGPRHGSILVASPTGGKPESLSDAATIARRVIALPHRAEDVGAMLLRNLVWQVHVKAGDGAAIAAVLSQAMLKQAYRLTRAGSNAMVLRRGMERAAQTANDALRAMARPAHNEATLFHLAHTVTGERDLSRVLSEMFDLVGPDGHITVEDYVAPYLEREYLEGGSWSTRLASPHFVNDVVFQEATLPSCHVLVYDGTIKELAQVQTLLELVAGSTTRRLLIAAHSIQGTALSALVANHQRKLVEVIGIEMRQPGHRGTTDLEDLATLTGARLCSPLLGPQMSALTAADLGIGRRVEVTAERVVVVGHATQQRTVQQKIDLLHAQLEATGDDEARERLRFRLARLSQRTAILKLGAATRPEKEVLVQKANKGVHVLPIGMREGIVPGGGVAFLNCIPPVRELTADGDEALGIALVARALEHPFRQLVSNAGLVSPDVVLAERSSRGDQFGYDVLTNEVVHMEEAGIIDAAGVLCHALQIAVGGASIALTTETIVLRRNPELRAKP